MRQTNRSVRLRRIASLIVLTAGAFASLATSQGSQAVETRFPMRLELSPASPVAVRDLMITLSNGDRSVGSGEIIGDFPGLDPRVRVAVLREGDRTLPGYQLYRGDLRSSLLQFSDCGDETPCRRPIRLVFEFTDAGAVAPVRVDGAIVAKVVSADPKLTGPAITITGLDQGPSGDRAIVRLDSVGRRDVVLDMRRPVVAYRVIVKIDPGARPKDSWAIVGASTLQLRTTGGDAPPPDVFATVTREPPPGVSIGRGGQWVGADPTSWSSPFPGCTIDRACQASYLVTFSWLGKPDSSRRFDWTFEAALNGYGPGGIPADASMRTAIKQEWRIPEDAPILERTLAGTVTLTANSANERARTEFTYRLGGVGSAPLGTMPAVPAIAVLTVRAVSASGPIRSDDRPLRLNVESDYTYQRTLDFAPDGQPRTIIYYPLSECPVGPPCDVIGALTLFENGSAPVRLPVTLEWKLTIRVMSFTSAPFSPDTTLELVPYP